MSSHEKNINIKIKTLEKEEYKNIKKMCQYNIYIFIV
jgi:hypothetical protein